MSHRPDSTGPDTVSRCYPSRPPRTGRAYPVTLFFSLMLMLCIQACGNDRAKPLHLGDPAPAFTGTDLLGNVFALDTHRGKPVVIRFFLTDCPYCRADTPAFNAFYRRYREAGLAMVYINSRDTAAETSRQFATELDIPFPVMPDPGGVIAQRYRVKAMPQTIVLSPDHRIIAAIGGGVSEAELQEVLGQYLNR